MRCLRRFFWVPYTTRRPNQSIWKEINVWPLLSYLRRALRCPGGKKGCFLCKGANHGSSKQIVCSSTPVWVSERLKTLRTLGLPMHVLHSPQQHWRTRKRHSGRWRREMAQGSTEATTYQVGLKRTEQAYVAESWWLGCGNKREPALHEVPHSKSPGGQAQW